MTQVYAFTELTAFVLNQLPTGSSFAVSEEDSSEQIFIPSQIARMQNIVPGDRISVRAIPNKHDGGAKWFAIFASPIPTTVTPQLAVTKTTASEVDEAIEILEAAIAPPAPPQETAAEVRELVNLALDSGGMWTTGQLRDELWPNEDFGSGDYRYKLLTNVLRDLHMSGAVAAVGRRNSMRGLLTNAHYTKEPQKVRFVWED